MPDHAETLDCEFTLALNNRTGKYFFCKDMIDASADLISSCRYWRVSTGKLPSKTICRILGRLSLIEVGLRIRTPISYSFLPRIHRRRPMVFTDPRECVLYALKSCDVVLCHDMGPLTHPQFYGEGVRDLYLRAFADIKTAKPLLLFVSEASRNEFIKLYGDDFPLLKVIHIPLRQGMERNDGQAVSGVPEKFFLTVGSQGTRKNQARSIEAFAATGLAREGYAYVICGGPEPGSEDIAALAKQTPGVLLPGYVNDAQLRWLYMNAHGFVLASLLEGFGLPAAEAIRYGQVPLLSAGGALQEVAGDGALYVDPHDTSDIASGMRHLATMGADERSERLARLQLSIQRFSSDAAVSGWRSTLLQALKASRQGRPGI